MKNRDYAGPCHIITETSGAHEKRRCLEENGHQGSHWSNAEPLPPGCPCDTIWCACPTTAQVSAGARFETVLDTIVLICNNCDQDVGYVTRLDDAVRLWNDHECHQTYTSTTGNYVDDGMKDAIEQLRKKLQGPPGNFTGPSAMLHVHKPVARRTTSDGTVLYVCECKATRPVGAPRDWT